MSKMKNLSRVGWVIVGLVAAMLLVPTMAVAATVAYNGIEGTNGTTTTQNKALVTSAGQLLTTQIQPKKYVQYVAGIYTASNYGNECDTVATIPSGEAFIAEQISVDVFGVNTPSSFSNPSGSNSNSSFGVYADSPTFAGDCGYYLLAPEKVEALGPRVLN